jgi:hypothetical protein
MARAHDDFSSLRFSRTEILRLIVALLLSALLHLVIWGGYHTGEKMGWWQKWHVPAWLHLKQKSFPLQAQMVHNEEPTIFVDVSHADADAPQQSRFYSDKNSRAANPVLANANVPRIEGSQSVVPKTEDAARPVKAASPTPPEPANQVAKAASAENAKADKTPELPKLQPSMPPPSPQPAEAVDDPAAPPTPGETDLPQPKKFNPVSMPTPTANASAQSQPVRPRTLKQALAQRDQIPGRQMQQDGGVARHADWAALDVKSSQFGDYDREIVEAVSQRWYDLLDSRRFAQDRSGKVMLRFKLKPDGSIIEMQTLENTVGELLGYLCQEAIEEAAPFAKWPPDMVRMIGANYREITFTFYYY